MLRMTKYILVIVFVVVFLGENSLLASTNTNNMLNSEMSNKEIESIDKDIDCYKLLPPPPGKIYFAADPDFGGTEDIVTVKRIKDFEKLVGKKIAWAYFSDNWMQGIHFPLTSVEKITQAGSIPFIRMMSRTDFDDIAGDQVYSIEKIASGVFDKELYAYAREAKKYAKPLLMEFGTEMNGDWFQWNGRYHGGGKTDGYGDPTYPDGPERFIDAYRHIIDIFREVGACNITWFFHVDIYSGPEIDWNMAKMYYPGDDYIDWIGVSAYGPQSPKENYWDSFSSILQDASQNILNITRNKPIALLEFGVTDFHPRGSKAEWLEDCFKVILSQKYLPFKAISYWHESWENSPGDVSSLRIDSSPESTKMFRDYIANDTFISKLYFKKIKK